MSQLQDLIVDNFSKHAETYDDAATVQRQAVQLLTREIINHGNLLPSGTLLEIGCGTGLLSQEIVKQFPNRTTIISDASEKMLTKCQSLICSTSRNLQLEVIKAEELSFVDKFAAIFSSFALQWFMDLDLTIAKIMNALAPNGIFFFAAPTAGSFKEWKDICLKANLPFSCNRLPDKAEIIKSIESLGYLYSLQTKAITINYASALEFFKAIRSLGALTKLTQTTISTSQLLKLIERWSEDCPDHIEITYEILYGMIQKTSP